MVKCYGEMAATEGFERGSKLSIPQNQTQCVKSAAVVNVMHACIIDVGLARLAYSMLGEGTNEP